MSAGIDAVFLLELPQYGVALSQAFASWRSLDAGAAGCAKCPAAATNTGRARRCVLRRRESARAAYERSVSLAQGLAVSHANVGRVTSRQSNRLASISSFERALRLAPLDARIALDAAEASLRLGDLELAAATLESVLRLSPSDGPAWLSLGRVRVLQNRRAEARALLQTSLEMGWRDWPEGLGQARALLAAVLVEQGGVERAREVLSGANVAALPDEVHGAPVRLR